MVEKGNTLAALGQFFFPLIIKLAKSKAETVIIYSKKFCTPLQGPATPLQGLMGGLLEEVVGQACHSQRPSRRIKTPQLAWPFKTVLKPF